MYFPPGLPEQFWEDAYEKELTFFLNDLADELARELISEDIALEKITTINHQRRIT